MALRKNKQCVLTESNNQRLNYLIPTEREINFIASIKSHGMRDIPQFSVYFEQNQLYSWVNIWITVSPSPDEEGTFCLQHTYNSEIYNFSSTSLQNLGIQEDEMMLLNTTFEQCKNMTVQISMENSFPETRFGAYTAVSKQPLGLKWQVTATLSKRAPTYFAKIPGSPVTVQFERRDSCSDDLTVSWVKKVDLKYLSASLSPLDCVCNLKTFCEHISTVNNTVIKNVDDYVYDDWKPCGGWSQNFSYLRVEELYKCLNKLSRRTNRLNRLYKYVRYKIPTVSFVKCNPGDTIITKKVNVADHQMYGKWQQTKNTKQSVVCKRTVECQYFSFKGLMFDYISFYNPHGDRCKETGQMCSDCWKPPTHRVSWAEAAENCSAVGGYLPLIKSVGYLEELVDILKFGGNLPPIEVMYIGQILNPQVIMLLSEF